jgi:hypothetical protein
MNFFECPKQSAEKTEEKSVKEPAKELEKELGKTKKEIVNKLVKDIKVADNSMELDNLLIRNKKIIIENRDEIAAKMLKDIKNAKDFDEGRYFGVKIEKLYKFDEKPNKEEVKVADNGTETNNLPARNEKITTENRNEVLRKLLNDLEEEKDLGERRDLAEKIEMLYKLDEKQNKEE